MAVMARAFVDTSAWFAYVNRLDANHTRIRGLFQTFQGRLDTSIFIFDETVTLWLYRLGYRVVAMVGEVLLDPTVVDLFRLTPEDEHRASTLFLARPDKMYSCTNCTSFVLM
jgi:predicted nucleic acid-binding protein